MNIVQSKYVQGTKTLYYSRKLRFDDLFADQYRRLFDLDDLTIYFCIEFDLNTDSWLVVGIVVIYVSVFLCFDYEL